MKNSEKKFLRAMEDKSLKIPSRVIDALMELYDSDHDCYVGYISDSFKALKNTRIEIGEKYNIILKLLHSNLRIIQKHDKKSFFGEMYLNSEIINNYLKKHSNYSQMEIEFLSQYLSTIKMSEIVSVEHLKIIEGIKKELDYENGFETTYALIRFLISILENGMPEEREKAYCEAIQRFQIDIDFFLELVEYGKNKDKVHEDKKEEIADFSKFSFDFDKESSLLSNKEYKNIRKEIDSIYDIRNATFKKHITLEEFYDLAIKIYKVYGDSELKPFFDNLLRTKDIDEKDLLKYFLDKILYYKNMLTDCQLEDLTFYLEMLSSEEDYNMWLSEIKKYVNEVRCHLPNNYEYEFYTVQKR